MLNTEFEPKELIFNKELTDKLLSGMEKVYRAVSSTMGPAGNCILFEEKNRLYPTATKDGVSVARRIQLADRFENIAAQMIIQAANKQVHETGDGTTLTVLLAYELFKSGLKMVGHGVNRSLLRNGMTRAITEVINKLSDMTYDADEDDIEYVANIATNGNEELAALIAEGIEKVGEHGIVTYGLSNKGKTYLDYCDGYRWNKGVMYPHFCTSADGKMDYEDCYVVVADAPIYWASDLSPLAELMKEKPCVIICSEIRDEALGAVLKNSDKFRISIISPEQIGFSRVHELADIAALTKATVISKETGLDIKHIKYEHLGKCKRIVSELGGKTTIYGYENIDTKEKRINELNLLVDVTDNEGDSNVFKRSLAKLEGGVAIINVHAATASEQKEICDRVEDAILACRCAQQEGIIAGGGLTLFRCQGLMDKKRFYLSDDDRGYEAVRRVLDAPIRKILVNADIKPDPILSKLRSHSHNGYNINTREATKDSMFDMRIVDPVKVIRTALLNAVSIASLMLQSKGAIAEERIDDLFELKMNRKTEGNR